MTLDAVLNYALLGALLVTAAAVHGFIYRYARYSDWRATQPGRSLMYAKVAIAIIIDLTIARWINPEWPGRLFVVTVCFWAIAISQTMLLRTLLLTQKRRKGGDLRTTDAGADPDAGGDYTHREGS